MGVVIETRAKYPGGPTRITVTDVHAHPSCCARLSAARRGVRPSTARGGVRRPLLVFTPGSELHVRDLLCTFQQLLQLLVFTPGGELHMRACSPPRVNGRTSVV
jgi:hypothetical protein